VLLRCLPTAISSRSGGDKYPCQRPFRLSPPISSYLLRRRSGHPRSIYSSRALSRARGGRDREDPPRLRTPTKNPHRETRAIYTQTHGGPGGEPPPRLLTSHGEPHHLHRARFPRGRGTHGVGGPSPTGSDTPPHPCPPTPRAHQRNSSVSFGVFLPHPACPQLSLSHDRSPPGQTWAV